MPRWSGQELAAATRRGQEPRHQGQEQELPVKGPVVREGAERQEGCVLVSLESSLLPIGMNSFSGLLEHSVIVANVFSCIFYGETRALDPQ